MQVAPSILSADFLRLSEDVAKVNAGADYIHLDIMDGTFVPNISFGFPVIKAVSGIATVPMDAHLMVVEPQRWFKTLADLGVAMTSFHLEAAGRHTSDYIERIHGLGMKAGVAIDPDVEVRKLYKYVGKADFFLIMSVFAGFGGQEFIYESLDRVAALKGEISRRGASGLIEVDGGINLKTAPLMAQAGADIAVAGSAVFGADDPSSVIAALKL